MLWARVTSCHFVSLRVRSSPPSHPIREDRSAICVVHVSWFATPHGVGFSDVGVLVHKRGSVWWFKCLVFTRVEVSNARSAAVPESGDGKRINQRGCQDIEGPFRGLRNLIPAVFLALPSLWLGWLIMIVTLKHIPTPNGQCFACLQLLRKKGFSCIIVSLGWSESELGFLGVL